MHDPRKEHKHLVLLKTVFMLAIRVNHSLFRNRIAPAHATPGIFGAITKSAPVPAGAGADFGKKRKLISNQQNKGQRGREH